MTDDVRKIVLRPYQRLAVDRSLSRYKTHRSSLVTIAVGLGKSHIMSEVAKQFNRVVVLQPCLELVKQNHEKLAGAGLNTTMIDSAHRGDWSADYIYTTPQTLSKNLTKCVQPELMIIDEANVFYEGSMFKQIFSAWQECKILALTATPYHYSRKTIFRGGWIWAQTRIESIEDVFGESVLSIDREEGRRMGYSPEIEFKKAPITRCYDEHFANRPVYKFIIDLHLEEVKNLLTSLNNAIIFCDSKRHAEAISEYCGVPTIFGTTPKKQRMHLIEQFNAGEIKFLATVGCLVRGYDRQDLENIVILTNYNNECETEQVIGRLNRGTCKKTCWYNSKLNTAKPVPGKMTEVRIRRI